MLRGCAKLVSAAPRCERRALLTRRHRFPDLWMQYNKQVAVNSLSPWRNQRAKPRPDPQAGSVGGTGRVLSRRSAKRYGLSVGVNVPTPWEPSGLNESVDYKFSSAKPGLQWLAECDGDGSLTMHPFEADPA